MRLLSILALSLLPLSGLAAKRSSVDRFVKYHTQSLSSGPLKLDEKVYDDLTATPRNYSAAILLTAREDRFGCQLCREFQPEWEVIAKSWAKGDKPGDSRVVFGTLDFADGKGPFQKMQLQTVPILVIFPATEGPDAQADGDPIRYTFSDGYAA